MAEGESSPVESVELRVMGVQHSLDVGMAEIKGTLAVLLLRSEHTDRAIAEGAQHTEKEFARRDVELAKELATRDKADDDRETRLRGVERRVYMAAGIGVVLSSSVFVSYILK